MFCADATPATERASAAKAIRVVFLVVMTTSFSFLETDGRAL
jgi:hypothetical protein